MTPRAFAAAKRGPAGALAGPMVLAAVFVLVSLALSYPSLGDTDRSVDETFFFFVGQRMHDGVLPYVDVWDRKPLGLFLIFYLIAGISDSVLSYQIGACLFSAATALVIARMAMQWTGWQGGLFAGLAYLLMAGPLEGNAGLAPDFYNLFIAGAGFLIVLEMKDQGRGIVGWRTWAAMGLCGLAITVKQTAFFESAFFGLYVLASLYRAGVPLARLAGVAAVCIALGALPTLLAAAFYWQAGHWHEFWHAMVVSNLAKASIAGKSFRLTGIVLRLAVLIALAVWGLAVARSRRIRDFLLSWLIAATIGFLSVPNFFVHYALPLLVPLCVAAGLLIGSHPRRLLLTVAFMLYAALWNPSPDRASTRASAAAMDAAAALIRRHDPGGGLLVYDGPSYLYALSGKPFLSPLVFPHHLASQIEHNVSHLDTHAEIDRILANRPGVIVMARKPYIMPVNRYTRTRVLAHAQANCRSADVVTLYDSRTPIPFVVFGNCAQ